MISRTLAGALAGAAMCLVLNSCGGATSGERGPRATPPPRTLHVGNADAGRTLHMRVGDSVVAFFQASPDQAALGEISTSDPRVLAPRVDTAATAVRGARLAKFQALSAGRADITVARALLCLPGASCPARPVLISVHFVVGG